MLKKTSEQMLKKNSGTNIIWGYSETVSIKLTFLLTTHKTHSLYLVREFLNLKI